MKNTDIKKEVICFIGLKRTGKDFNSKHYIEELNFKKIALADPLREMLWSILGFKPNKDISYDDFKILPLTIEKTAKIFGLFKSYTDVVVNTGRGLLQNLGTVMREYIDEDFWCNLWCKKVLECNSNVVCTDMRYINEIYKALSLTRKGCKVTFVWTQFKNANYKELLQDKHSSEALAKFMYENREKYGLTDCCTINHTKIKQICNDFQEALK